MPQPGDTATINHPIANQGIDLDGDNTYTATCDIEVQDTEQVNAVQFSFDGGTTWVDADEFGLDGGSTTDWTAILEFDSDEVPNYGAATIVARAAVGLQGSPEGRTEAGSFVPSDPVTFYRVVLV